jgi:hypothetical protein
VPHETAEAPPLTSVSAPRSAALRELRPARPPEIDPTCEVSNILKEHRGLVREVTKLVKEAHAQERDASLKEIKAFDTLISEAFRIAARGPAFLLPATVVFLHIAERSQKLIGVECPTVEQALINEELHARRGEIIAAPRLLNHRPRDLISGSVNNSSEQVLEEKKEDINIVTQFGVPLIQVGDHVRLPRHTEPVENVLLTSAFLTLVEECLHASQEQRRSRLDEMHPYNDNHGVKVEDITVSKLAPTFFRETNVDLSHQERNINLTSATLEIDVVARAVELAREHNFPLQCLTPELRLYHTKVRSDFVGWLEKQDLIPIEDGSIDYSFKENGKAAAVPLVKVSLTEDAKDLLEFLEETADGLTRLPRYRGLLPALGKIVGDVAEFSLLAMRAEQIDAASMKRVLANVKAAEGSEAIPNGWHAFASEEYTVHQNAIAALALQEYLSRIGFLKER